jgi:hypothetical protein
MSEQQFINILFGLFTGALLSNVWNSIIELVEKKKNSPSITIQLNNVSDELCEELKNRKSGDKITCKLEREIQNGDHAEYDYLEFSGTIKK